MIAITFRTPSQATGKWVLRITHIHKEGDDGNVTFQAVALRDVTHT